jgi:hypothetical protein
MGILGSALAAQKKQKKNGIPLPHISTGTS